MGSSARCRANFKAVADRVSESIGVSVRRPESDHDDFAHLKEFFQYEATLTLKGVFDSIRNSGMATGIIALGFWTFDPASTALTVFGAHDAKKWSIALIAIGTLLFALCTAQSLLLAKLRLSTLPDWQLSPGAWLVETFVFIVAFGTPLIIPAMAALGLVRGVIIR